MRRSESTTVRLWRRATLASLTLLAALACSPGATTPEEQEALEQAFEESMRGAALVGKFTIFGEAGQSQGAEGEGREIRLRSERYEIEKAVKRTGDLWTFPCPASSSAKRT